MLLNGIFKDYKIQKQLGYGAFGQVYVVKSDKDSKLYAGKVEFKSSKHSALMFEIKLYPMLQSSKYIPRFIEGGTTDYTNYLIMEYIGPSLSQYLTTSNRTKFSKSSGLRIAYHMLKAIHELHNLKVVHRDIKPSNFLISDDKEYPIKIIDFGLSRIYIDKNTGLQFPARDNPGFKGTLVYCSVNAHNQKELSRIDDIISWYYVSVDLLTGRLPWKNIEIRDEIYNYKNTHDMSQLFRPDFPELAEIWKYIKNLKYDDEPNYDCMFTLINMALSRAKINLSDHYDWEPCEEEEDEENSYE